MSNLSKKLMMGAAGGAAGEGEYIEDIFSTWLYTGNGSTQTITNGIDLAGEGGMVWLKARTSGGSSFTNNSVVDSARGAGSYGYKSIYTNLIDNEFDPPNTSQAVATAFTSSGFSLGGNANTNYNTGTYASWTFRKAPGFFDVVTYAGNSGTNNVAHNLGSVPGCIIVKSYDATVGSATNWNVYHRSLGGDVLRLQTDAEAVTGYPYWGAVTDTTFQPPTLAGGNESGKNYVAYLFAHDEQIFGESGDQSVIKCGSVVTNAGTGKASVNLGWEPQWLLTKVSSTAGYNWFLCDNMRGVSTPVNTSSNPVVSNLFPNLNNAEDTAGYHAYFTPTGFEITGNHGGGTTVIYIAIRRGPMKTPTDATKVFYVGTAASSASYSVGFPSDAFLMGKDTYTGALGSRLTGAGFLRTPLTDAENANLTWFKFDQQNNFEQGLSAASTVRYNFRRAPGFFDVVAYTGTGVARTVSHNLGVAPELMIVKKRSTADAWAIYSNSTGNGKYLVFNANAAVTSSLFWNNTSPTSSVFTVGTDGQVNGNTSTYIAYLFATLPGVSKVGSYTGTGTTLNVDCGFTSGARFVLIKRTDPGSTGDWYVWDTARGIVAGNDPYLLLNSTAAENTSTDYIDPLSSGFQISSTAPAAINANGGTYIYLAIA